MLAPVLLTSCVTAYPDLTQSRSPCRSEPGGWCDFVREAAVEAYPYAMLSSNAYVDEDTYTDLPYAFLEREQAGNDDSGLAYAVFDRHEVRGRQRILKARVIAFRGTEFGSTSDIFSGSLGDGQRERARAVYQAERAALDAEGYADVLIETTGHSLGGALATQISIDHPEVRAFVFNTSPFFSGDPRQNDRNRLAITERGEFLRVLRRYKAPPASEAVVINCSPSASAGEKHSIRKLADCLTWIAAYEDEAAFKALAPNGITKPEIECGEPDKMHPGRSTGGGICAHAPKGGA
ncbi:hypothetical protein ACFCW2_10125 [Qipengyuania sp. DSG2-2]|uniref:hypothetical protein n=1 Tax=Qipengyuania sp. DGS2-2 TaxID=3349631 RepID=UPI0036D2C397